MLNFCLVLDIIRFTSNTLSSGVYESMQASYYSCMCKHKINLAK